LDELLALVWKKPAFFLAHPRVIAAFGRECTRRGVPPPTLTLGGSPFLTWRGLPIVPTNKLATRFSPLGRLVSDILLIRVGEQEQGVIGLHHAGLRLEPRQGPGQGPPVRAGDALREPPAGIPHLPPERDGPLYFLAGSTLRDGGGAGGSRGAPVLDVAKVRRDFPALHQSIDGRPLVWLDNA